MSVPVVASNTLAGKTTGKGTTVDFVVPMAYVTMVVAPTGTITGGVVGLEASQDGLVWVAIASREMDPLVPLSIDFRSGAYRYWRGAIHGNITGGGTVSATLMGVT